MDIARKRQLGAAAVVMVALVGAGAAFAASKLHGHSTGRATFGAASTGGTRPDRGLGGYGGAPRFGFPGGGGFPGRGGPGNSLATAADYLGISSAMLQADLQAGKTLAQVADATGAKSAAGLVAALVTHERSELDAAVTAGRITKAQEGSIVATLEQRFTDLVNGRPGSFGFGRHGFGYGSLPPGGGNHRI